MVTINEIIALAERAKNSGINRIYCHHTGGLYKMNSVEKEHYHICIESDGTVRINGELTDYKEHTWHRNSNAIGIALCCAYGATVYKNPERIRTVSRGNLFYSNCSRNSNRLRACYDSCRNR